ncbi:HpcH/HpaI aldolase family protein [Palleronia abyssalis]|nr:HpcH/HpaI aldolase/citrate lyase family protein [Palleronia abyssalis]
MKILRNSFKERLISGRHQLGLWNAIPGPVVSELLAHTGFDWIVVDTEHSPIEVSGALPALQALATVPDVGAVVRPAANDVVLIKRHLDQGAQTLLIPQVQSAEEASAAVSAMRYPPRGGRGVAGLHRASLYGAIPDYITAAEAELCLIVQIETATALDRLEAIATVEGVDGIFIGPSDLSASMGYPGELDHPEVRSAIDGAIDRAKAVGVPIGILATGQDTAAAHIARGTSFTAVGLDVGILANGARALRAAFN